MSHNGFKVGDVIRRTKECMEEYGLSDIDENGEDTLKFEILELLDEYEENFCLLVQIIECENPFSMGKMLVADPDEAELLERDGEVVNR